ncbi:LamG-like jellyroll fold domain-containing protein [Zavarzinella formosa]|uniref:LamG-like jellyroll fold domain-containing protein n=1 Tax=Zavarzinella formosa TaxID=360055 RepID=UPI00037CD0A3|nr:LamG-like jellyroll fold domain-containing protein [Zavarzinella formosa]
MFWTIRLFVCGLTCWIASANLVLAEDTPLFRAGAAAVDITPTRFPVVVNGMFEERYAKSAADRLMARAVVLDDGRTRIALCIVDNLMMPRELIDAAKDLAKARTDIPTDKMLVSATHTHSAPSVMGCLGSGIDKDYTEALPGLIAKAIETANKNLEPAKIGWGVIQDWDNTHCRRWIRRPDKLLADPFNVKNVRANMHPGYQSPDAISPSGPADPDMSLFSLQARNGRPIAVLGNYAMHYYGSPLVSGDVCGRFGEKLATLIDTKAGSGKPPFVGILSQGTSGDIMWMDYAQMKRDPGLDKYSLALANDAKQVLDSIKYHDWVPLAMAETKITLARRTPDAERLAWARKTVAEIKKYPLTLKPEIYAREQIYLHDEPTRELKLQAIRIGDLGITGIPDEVYALTGLKLKRQSPLAQTFNIELANGADGYIPPPEQHKLGGYTTWAARTAGLEVEAEPKIVESLLGLLEKVADQRRKSLVDEPGEYTKAVLASKPVAYWRLNEMAGKKASSAVGKLEADIEDGVVFYLPGPASTAFSGSQINRAMHFAGGRLRTAVSELKNSYSVELWFWNGLPSDARTDTGFLFGRGQDKAASGDILGIGGSANKQHTGKLVFTNGDLLKTALAGEQVIPLKTWVHLVFVRDGKHVSVYLNGHPTPEISGDADMGCSPDVKQFFIGGRNDGIANWEGKLDEVSLYDRPLTAKEAAEHFAASKLSPTR